VLPKIMGGAVLLVWAGEKNYHTAESNPPRSRKAVPRCFKQFKKKVLAMQLDGGGGWVVRRGAK